MNICLVHNEYGKFSGEEAVVLQQLSLLIDHGHTVEMFTRSSAGIPDTLAAKAMAFFSGIYNPASRRAFRNTLASFKPALVHVHNVFPMISPSVLPECRKLGIPVVMTLHNFRLVCPNALLTRRGEICRKCLGGREWHCVADNCENSLLKSAGYALRTFAARRMRWFLDNVDVFICLTDFQRGIYISEGFPPDRCIVIPNFIPVVSNENRSTAAAVGSGTIDNGQRTTDNFVLYVGRVSPEKDVPTLLEAASRLPGIPFKIAGSYWRMPGLPGTAPANVQFLGEVPEKAVHDLYERAAIVVFATLCYEGLPAVLLEAMSHARPVVCTRLGGLPEIVEDGRQGLLYNARDAADLAGKIERLWTDGPLCATLGGNGRMKVFTTYGPDKHYDQLMAVYEQARSQRTR